jgi:pimeloyl-ACP methyl ester carboxylesterase
MSPSSEAGSDPGPPSLALLLLEGRAVFEGLSLAGTAPLLRRAPRGDGHPVLVLPGFTAGDPSTGALRRFLRQQGFSPHPWLLGRNSGPSARVRDGLAERVDDLATRYGRKLSVVGWSLGGIYARELAKRMPDHVRGVITLGSPFADAGRASNASRLFDRISGNERPRATRAVDALREPPPVPSTAIYTRTDGIVHWKACLERESEQTENIEVPGSHCGLGVNPLVLYAVADRLSQAEGRWQPFERTGWRRIAYS